MESRPRNRRLLTKKTAPRGVFFPLSLLFFFVFRKTGATEVRFDESLWTLFGSCLFSVRKDGLPMGFGEREECLGAGFFSGFVQEKKKKDCLKSFTDFTSSPAEELIGASGDVFLRRGRIKSEQSFSMFTRNTWRRRDASLRKFFFSFSDGWIYFSVEKNK